MTTRAATFTAKIRNLKDYHSRMINNLTPLPSGIDIANTLKYFSQTLLSVLKDVPFIPSEMYAHRTRDSVRLSMFPSLNYSGLYEGVMNIIDVAALVQQGQHTLGESILNVLGCLVPFLEYDLLDTLPYTVASTLAVFPETLQSEVVDLLCTNLLPLTLGYDGIHDTPTYATESTSAILMMVFQYISKGEHHSQVLECLMSMKHNMCKDLLMVIAFGPPSAKAPAVNHLFYYWPQLNPASADRRGIHYKYSRFYYDGWIPVSCQRERKKCPNSGNVQAIKVCLDPSIAIECGDHPPPLYACADCCNMLQRNGNSHFLTDLLKPHNNVSLVCENKNCKSSQQEAVCTCFSMDCVRYNSYHPIRYCTACHSLKHSNTEGTKHVYHLSIPLIWECEADIQNFITEAIISLLKEAQPLQEKRTVEMGEERMPGGHFEEEESEDGEEGDDRKLLSRYGVWLMVELCPPREDVNAATLGRLIAMLFQWFDATAYLPDDNAGSALERLKPDYIRHWIEEASKNHLEVVVSCLLPHPPEYAKVGGYWDTLASRTSQIKEGLNRMFCLVPYNIISYEVWDYVMPFWLEAIRTEVPEEERHELKVLLCKTFDTDMSPLPFNSQKVYHFFIERFENTGSSVQEQNLAWLQILSAVGILVPMDILLGMFQKGVESLSNPVSHPETPVANPLPRRAPLPQRFSFEDYLPGSPLTPLAADGTPGSGASFNSSGVAFTFDHKTMSAEEVNIPNTTCIVMMLDVLIKQFELHEATPHLGVYNDTCRSMLVLLTSMLNLQWDGKHTCDKEDEINDCDLCEVSAIWYQLLAQVMEFIAPRNELKLPVKDLPKVEELQRGKTTDNQGKKNGEEEEPEVDPEFDVESLPAHLQLLYALIKALDQQADADCIQSLLVTLKFLCLHAECLNYTITEHEDFVKYCLKKYLEPCLWKLLQAEHSHIALICVPLLLHCLTLNTGADVFWNLVEDDFSNEDWKIRFAAVEKVTVLARLIVPRSIQNNQQIKTSLAHAFCHLIGSLNDINSAVIQRTVLYLETIKKSSINCIRQCLEFQFDSVISDRTMILRKVCLLATVLRDETIFSWEFFLNRFDTLCLEAQLDLEHTGDITSLQDLHSSDHQSDHFLRKINRARFALARTDSIRSVSFSIYATPPYRRAASVPMHLLTKTLPNQQGMKDNEQIRDIHRLRPYLEIILQETESNPTNQSGLQEEKDKSPYKRQQSAPQFRSRGSRFGMGMFSNYMFPCGQMREFTDVESNFAALLQRAMDLEGVDRETLHHLVTLLMKFMITSNQYDVMDDRGTMKAQNIVLRHLNVLLGYNQTEKAFSVPPYKLRYSAVFNAYISGLPKVLDKNYELGNLILPVSMTLLQYCPSPQRYASDYQPPNYTLWYLEPHTRQSWLSALLVILYKYQYNTSPASSTIQTLVRLAINTIEAQLHRCKRQEEAFGPASPIIPRTRDTSNVSVGDLENILETDTPPAQSPSDSQHSLGETVTISITSPSSTTVQYKKKGDSDRTEETDLESLPPSKIASPTPPGLPISPGSTSPISSKPSSPVLLPRSQQQPSRLGTLFRGRSLGSPTEMPKSVPHVSSPTEALAAMQRDQPRRIAEYHRSSLVEGMLIGDHSGAIQRLAHWGKTPPPMIKQKTEPALKYQPFQQRTLEQSVEEYMMEQVGHRPSPHALTDSNLTSEPGGVTYSPGHSPQDVDRKIAEQLQLFESQNEAKKRPDLPPKPLLDIAAMEKLRFHAAGAGALWDKPHGLGIERFETVLEEVKETEEESIESPKKLVAGVVYEDLVHDTGEGETETSTSVVPTTSSEKACSTATPSEKALSTATPSEKAPSTATPSEKAGSTAPCSEKASSTATSSEKATSTATSSEKANSTDTAPLEDHIDAQQTESDLDESPCPSPGLQPRLRPQFRQRKQRKTGLTNVELQKMIPELADLSSNSDKKSPNSSRKARRSELMSKSQQSAGKRSMSAMRATEEILVDRCPDCNAVLEQYDEETISLSIVCLATFIHREPCLAAPLLLDMLQAVARIASSSPYPWQADIAVMIPGNSVSIARQFMRCTLHQMAPNGVFPQIFMADIEEPEFLKTIAVALIDFSDLNSYSALQLILEGVNEIKNLTTEQITNMVSNLAVYMDCISLETASPTWNNILVQFDIFFRRLQALLPNPCDIGPVLNIMVSVLKIPGLTAVKGILEPFSKLLSFTIQHCSFQLQQLVDICSLCGRAFTKERDKLFLSRCVVFEIIQAMKFKTSLPDENFVLLVQLLLMDAGGTIGSTNIAEELANVSFNPFSLNLMSTNMAECMKQHINECIEFVADIHTINKVKSSTKAGTQNLNEDTLGSLLKAAIAQYISLEFMKISSRDSRGVGRYLPWLYHPPTSIQQGPREFTDCVGHIRLLSWILLGSLTHTALTRDHDHMACQPLPLESSSYIADHVMVIMTGFAEQSKMSVLHMSSLFHAFILCQMWTMYCESYACLSSSAENYQLAHSTIMDFWGRVTPGILQLISHSKVLAEMVNLHFLSLMEALQECNSTVLSELYPMWSPILFSYHSQLPGHMQVRLQICHNWEPKELNNDISQLDSGTLLKWLKRLQFKLGQIEVQSSAATQFFTV